MICTLLDLPYAYDILEPYTDEETMHLHHDKHYNTYVTNLNSAIEKYPELDEKTIEELLSGMSAIPTDTKTAIRNNGGGHANHSFFWEIMAPNASDEPTGEIRGVVNEAFGDFSSFKEEFKKATARRFGSGWAWPIMENGELAITSTANQDSPLMGGETPILGLDVWEYAYYLKCKNTQSDYIVTFQNATNRDGVDRCFEAAK